MKLKDSVRILGAKPELVIALMICDAIYSDNDERLTVTSIVDGHHSRTSRHYLGMAADLRTNNIDETTTALISLEIKRQLPEFYVVLENEGTPNEHIHIQFNGQHS